MSSKGIALAIVGKVPRVGSCKTRLVPPLTFETAAQLSTAFLRDTADNVANVAVQCGATPVALYFGDADETELGTTFTPEFLFVEQRGADLGERLANGAAELFARGHDGVCLIDSDSPTVPAASLARAVHILQSGIAPVTLGRALDGGYYLLGMKQYCDRLFRDIVWSTEVVAQQTRERAREAGLEVCELPPWFDVDDADGLEHLLKEFKDGNPGGGYWAPATRATVSQLFKTPSQKVEACALS